MSKCYLCKTEVNDENATIGEIGDLQEYRRYKDMWIFHTDCFKAYEEDENVKTLAHSLFDK